MSDASWHCAFLGITVARHGALARLGKLKNSSRDIFQKVDLLHSTHSADILQISESAIKTNRSIYYSSLRGSAPNELLNPKRQFALTLSGVANINAHLHAENLQFPVKVMRARVYLWDAIIVYCWRTNNLFELVSKKQVNEVEEGLSETGHFVSNYLYTKYLTEDESYSKQNIFWTSRSLIYLRSTESERIPFLASWRSQAQEVGSIDVDGEKLEIGWGNCLIEVNAENSNLLDQYEIANAKMQFLYAGLEQISYDLKPYLQRLIEGCNPKPILKQVRNLKHHFFVMDYIMLETKHKVQGVDRIIFDDFVRIWRMDSIKISIDVKLARISSIATDISSDRVQKMQQRLGSFLILIGTIEIIGALVEIVDLADSKIGRSRLRFGILHLVRGISPDLVITGTTAVLLAITLLAIFYGEKGKD